MVLRVGKVAEALDCSVTTVRRLIWAGSLPAVMVAGGIRVRVEDLHIFIDQLPGLDRRG